MGVSIQHWQGETAHTPVPLLLKPSSLHYTQPPISMRNPVAQTGHRGGQGRQGTKAAGGRESGAGDNPLTEARHRAQRSRSDFPTWRIFFWVLRRERCKLAENCFCTWTISVLIVCRKKGTRMISETAGGDYLERISLIHNLIPQDVLRQNWKWMKKK